MLENTNERKNQRTMILEHLKQYGSITSLEAFNLYAVMQCATRIYELKRLGYDIASIDHVANNRFGKKVRFTEYKLRGE